MSGHFCHADRPDNVMRILTTTVLRGPNIWSRRPVIEALVDLEDLKDKPSNEVPGLNDRLASWLPSLIEHRCSEGVRGGFFLRLKDGTYCGHILEHLWIELQNLAGSEVGFGKTRETNISGVYFVVARFECEELGLRALDHAFQLLMHAIEGKDFDVRSAVVELKEIYGRVGLGMSSKALMREAEKRGIPVLRLGEGSLLQLGFASKQRRVWAGETDATSAIGAEVAKDKQLTRMLLKTCGYPVAEGVVVKDASEAWAQVLEFGGKATIKPRDGNHGRGVFPAVSTEKEAKIAFDVALSEGSAVMVEQFIEGEEHRVLVVGDKVVSVCRGEHLYVVGDGVQSVRSLIETQINTDPRRSEDENTPLNKVTEDSEMRLELKRQGLTLDSVPEAGRKVLISRHGNLADDVTKDMHPETARICVEAVKVVGLDIAGVDIVCKDIATPLEEQGGAIVEINSSPGLHCHLLPRNGERQPVEDAILSHLFPNGDNGRVPIVFVMGDGRTDLASWLIMNALAEDGFKVGLSFKGGVVIDGKFVSRQRSDNFDGCRRLLLNPSLDACVMEVSLQSLLNEGLGFDKCKVAVLLKSANTTGFERHLGILTKPLAVYRCAVDFVEKDGHAVLFADDPFVNDLEEIAGCGLCMCSTSPIDGFSFTQSARIQSSVWLDKGRILYRDHKKDAPETCVDNLPDLKNKDVVEAVLAFVAGALLANCSMSGIRRTVRLFFEQPDGYLGSFGVRI